MRRIAAACTLIALVGCGGGAGDGPAELPACTFAPSPATSPTGLPPRFPTPEGVEYTSEEAAGPSTILEGYWSGATLEAAFNGYKQAFADAGYQVTDEEREASDAEVNFAGGNSTGQVRLTIDCADRVDVGITIRPGSS
jgi:hypothetical protein